MTPPRERSRLHALVLAYPSALLVVFFLVPMGIMFATSVFHRTALGYEAGFELDHYIRVFESIYLHAMWVTVEMSALAAFVAICLALPFAFFLTQFSSRAQTICLVLVLGVLSLSEVIVAFSWSVVLSRPAGISNLLAWLGAIDGPTSWARGYWAVLISLTYFNIPFAILMLYPHCSRLDPSYLEAARTMGASPLRAGLNVVLPILKRPLLSTGIVLFVFTMGAVVTPQWLGQPEQWMLAVHISKQATEIGNVPFAAALSVVFLVVTVALVLLANALAGRRMGRADA